MGAHRQIIEVQSHKHNPTDQAGKRGAKSKERSLRRQLAYGAASLGALILAVIVLAFVFGGVILNHYGKQKASQAFAKAYPGCVLRLGELHYALHANCLIAQSLTLSDTPLHSQSGPDFNHRRSLAHALLGKGLLA